MISRFSIVIILCSTILLATAQKPLPVDSVTMKIGYKEVLKIDTFNARDFYKTALAWAKTHIDTGQQSGDPRITIKQTDEDSSRITAIGKFKCDYSDYQNTSSLTVYYTLVIEARNGRARIKITDLEHDNITGVKTKAIPYEQTYYSLGTKSKPTQNAWLAFFGQSDGIIKSIIASYKNYVLHPPVAAKPYVDEW